MPRVTRIAVALVVPALALAGITACSSSSSKPDSSVENPAPVVPVGGTDVSALVGKWVGDYSSSETGRSGSIVIEFKSGGKVARGDVLMQPKGYSASAPQGTDPLKSMPQVLSISFVNVEGGAGTVKGTMDPYTDPACNCQVDTTFVGKITGDTIEGTFSTTPSGQNAPKVGRWKVTRQPTK
jgi:hypothetical protein